MTLDRRFFPAVTLLFALVGSGVPGAPSSPGKGDPSPALDLRLFGTSEDIAWEDFSNEVVILDFWATWCSPCIEAIPELNALVREFAGKPVKFLSITYEPEHMVAPFLKKHPIESTVCIDHDFATFRSYQAWAIPMIVIINQGKIVSVNHPNHLTSEVITDVLNGGIPDVKQTISRGDPAGAEKYFRSLIHGPEH
jgi:thiol-disulfide isomerase/thioredoxin